MAFVSPDLAESVELSSETVVDGAKTTEANLNDNNTGTSASEEMVDGDFGYKITHNIGFSVANIDTLSVRCFDGSMGDPGDIKIYPYQSDDANVNTGNPGTLTINDNGAYDTLVMSAAFIADLQDVGTNQISIRFAAGPDIEGFFNEIQLDVTATAGGIVVLRRRIEGD